MTPHFVATWAGAIELKAKPTESSRDFAIRDACQATHLRNRDGNAKFLNRALLIAEDSREGIAVITTRFDDFAREALRDLDGLSGAATFRHEAGNVRAGCEVAAVFQRLDPDANGHFVNLGQVFLLLH